MKERGIRSAKKKDSHGVRVVGAIFFSQIKSLQRLVFRQAFSSLRLDFGPQVSLTCRSENGGREISQKSIGAFQKYIETHYTMSAHIETSKLQQSVGKNTCAIY